MLVQWSKLVTSIPSSTTPLETMSLPFTVPMKSHTHCKLNLSFLSLAYINVTFKCYIHSYRMVFIFFAFSFLHHLLLLPLQILIFVKAKKSRLSPLLEFSWLVAFPIIVVVFAVFTGLLCEFVIYNIWSTDTLIPALALFHENEANSAITISV